jgi:hypothetical protein
MMKSKVDLAAAERIKEFFGSMIQWEHYKPFKCVTVSKAIVVPTGTVEETVEYVRSLKNRPQGQGFEYRLLENDLIEFTVTCDSSD